MTWRTTKVAELRAALVGVEDLAHAINDDLAYLDPNMSVDIASDPHGCVPDELDVDTGFLADVDSKTYTDYYPMEPPPITITPPSPVLSCCMRFGWRLGEPQVTITGGHIRYGLRGLEQWVRCVRLAARALGKDMPVRRP